MGKLIVAVARFLSLCAVLLAIPTVATAQALAPGWYRNSGPSTIYEDSKLRITWKNSYIYRYPGSDPLYWYAQVEYRNIGNQPLGITCVGVADPSLAKEHIRDKDGGYLGYVPAEETFCSRNPNSTFSIEPGGAHYNWAIFHNVPWAGQGEEGEVSLEWNYGLYSGFSPWVDPWHTPFNAPPPAVCPPELVTLGFCQESPSPTPPPPPPTPTPTPPLGPNSIRSVYTTDENFNNKVVFMPGDRINYHVDVDNNTGSEIPIDVRFKVFSTIPFDPNLYSYDQTIHLDNMPVGLSRFYNPTILPNSDNILTPNDYIIRISVTPSNSASPENDGDWGENRLNIQKTKAPEGKVPNLIVLVHGCCTDADDVIRDWGWDNTSLGNNSLGTLIKNTIDPTEWEVVVWDWHKHTPLLGEISPEGFRHFADAAYQAAKQQGVILANAIKIHPSYRHVHLIGHSAGGKLIHEAATAYITDFFVRQRNPFIHLTFLDAYTPNEWDKSGPGSYGSLPAEYRNHYSEHYVDKRLGWPFNNADLTYAFNLDITDCPPSNSFEEREFGHQWPRYWYQKSVTRPRPGYGYPLSLEGGNNEIANRAGMIGALTLHDRDCMGGVSPPSPPTPTPTPSLPPVTRANPGAAIVCQGAACGVSLTCNNDAQCITEATVFVRPRGGRSNSGAAVTAPRMLKLASGMADIPPRQTATVRPRFTKRGKVFLRASRADGKKRFNGTLQLRDVLTGTVISNTPIRVRLR